MQQAGNSSRIFVSVGSSCNYCQEREVARASVISMDPDGGKPKVIAQGIRNAVDLRFVPDVDGGRLFATDMGDDHLGDKLPDDTFFEIDPAPANRYTVTARWLVWEVAAEIQRLRERAQGVNGP